MRLISLIGLPGAGKTTIAKRLVVSAAGFELIDVDHVIEQQVGCSIRDFFALCGEQAFRDMEEEALDRLTAGASRKVLSTGGGVVLRENNRRVLRERTCVVYLRAQPQTIYRRLRNDRTRPLLQVEDPLKRIMELHDERAPLYEATAHFILDVDGNQRTRDIAKKILQCAQVQSGAPMPYLPKFV